MIWVTKTLVAGFVWPAVFSNWEMILKPVVLFVLWQ